MFSSYEEHLMRRDWELVLVFSQLPQMSLAPIFSVRGGLRQPSLPYLCSGPLRSGRKRAVCGQRMTAKPGERVGASPAECGAGKPFNLHVLALVSPLDVPVGSG